MERVLVIGAAGGIGSAVCHTLVARGAEVIATSRVLHRAQSLPGVKAKELDAENIQAVQACVAEIQAEEGPLTGIVNCAGSVLLKAAHMTRAEEYQAILRANLDTAFAVVSAAGKHMKQGGSVVLLGSAAAMEGLASHEAIAAAKGGVIALARSAAASYAGQNLRVNTVSPGLIETPMTQAITGNEMSRKLSEEMHALGRIGMAHEVASMICWLLSLENSWVTGQNIAVDGGLSRVRPKAKI